MRYKKILAGIVLPAALAVAALPALAAELIGPSRDTGNVVISSQQQVKDLYTAGGNVTINPDVLGDLVSAGGMVTVAGKVEKELILAGGTIVVTAPVGGHARIAGGNVTVSAPVGGDLVIAGGNINLTEKAKVSGDLLVAGGNVVVDAPIAGKINMIGGNLTINSKVEGGVTVQATQKLIFGPNADVVSEVSYKGASPAEISPTAKVGKVNYTKIERRDFRSEARGILTLAFILKLLAWFLAGLVAVRLMKNSVHGLVSGLKAKPWGNLGTGFAVAVLVPILTVLLLISMVGYYLGFVLGAAFLLALLLANLLASVAVGYWLLGYMNKPGESPVAWQAVVIGVVVWQLLAWLPVIGWLAKCVAALMVLGIIYKTLKARLT